jgi:NADPH:quinone reductase-like Zn-dependent oxidoreductase
VLAAAFETYGEPEVLRWADVPDPICGPTDVVIEVKACGVNHSDLDSRAGISRWPFTFPWVLGAELSGVVAEVGPEVEGISDGDVVTALQQFSCGHCPECTRWRPDLCTKLTVLGTDCWGGYGSYAQVPARAVVELDGPAQILPAAAAQCVVSTAWSMVVALAAVRPGEQVLVPSASGGVASAAVQCAKVAGATVIASVGSPAKMSPVAALGADHVFCYRDVSVAEAVAEHTDGQGVDIVIDTVGGPLFGEHLQTLRPDGRLVTCGAHAGEVVALDLIELFRNGQRIIGFRVATPDELRAALQLVFDEQIIVPIDRTFPLSHAAEAHTYMAERQHVGKIVLTAADRDGR